MKKAVLIIVSILLFSCEQKEGERCQQNSDCAYGLICCKPSGSAPTSSGVCKPPSECIEADTTTDTVEDTAGDEVEAQDLPGEEGAEEEAAEVVEEDIAQDTPVEEGVEEIVEILEEDMGIEEAEDDPVEEETGDGSDTVDESDEVI